jgi:DNA-binding transcriptional LysR family regulator
MEFTQLQAFVGVATNHSFSKTASQLHLTQPAISKRISTLESHLGCDLFDRIGHRIVLTDAGKHLLPKAIKILQDIEDCKRFIHNLDDAVSGTLSLASSHHIGLHRLPEILKIYAKQYEEVELDFKFLESEQACAAVHIGEIEVAIITLPLETNDKLITETLWVDQLICVASNEHPLCKIPEITLETLCNFPILLPEQQTYTSQIIERPFIKNNLKLNPHICTNELESLRMMVEIGLGWSVLPHSMLREPLREIIVDGLNLHRTLGIIWHRDRTLSNAAIAMNNLLKSTRDEHPQHQ